MIPALLNLLITLLVAGIFYWAATAILALLPIPDPFKAICNIIIIVIVALLCIYALAGLIGIGHPLVFSRY